MSAIEQFDDARLNESIRVAKERLERVKLEEAAAWESHDEAAINQVRYRVRGERDLLRQLERELERREKRARRQQLKDSLRPLVKALAQDQPEPSHSELSLQDQDLVKELVIELRKGA